MGSAAAGGRTLSTAFLAALLAFAGCGEADGETVKPGPVAAGGASAAPATPAAAKPAEKKVPGFEEVAEAAGLRFMNSFLPGEQGERFKINLYDHGSGVSVGDADGDGRDDIYLVNQLGPNGLFRSKGDGTFEDVTAAAGVGLGDRINTSAAFADYDNDGDQDLYVASTRGGNVLFRNDGKGRFEDVTEAAGLKIVCHTQGITFFDADGDGDLDLFLSNTAKWTNETREPGGRYWEGAADLFSLVQSKIEKNVLYRNEGNGKFTDVTAESGVSGVGWGGDMAVFDADGDGDQDLFLTNMFGVNALYRNDGTGKFANESEAMLGRTSWGAVGSRVLDYDGDGLLDLFVVDMHSDMWMNVNLDTKRIEEGRKFAGPEGPMVDWGMMGPQDRKELHDLVLLDAAKMPKVVFGSTLFRNLGGGKFEEVSGKAGVETLWPWGIAAADFDGNGYEDAFIPTGMGYPYFPWHNSLLMNRGDGTFARRATEEGIEPRPGGPYLPGLIGGRLAARSSRSAAVLDYNGDGAPDLVVNNFNERPYLYRNRFPQRHWVALRLRGTAGNRDAVGAVARIEAGGKPQVRQVCNAGGYLAQSSRTLYFGLADAGKIDRCEVTWPGGAKQEIRDLAVDRVHEVTEPAAAPK